MTFVENLKMKVKHKYIGTSLHERIVESTLDNPPKLTRKRRDGNTIRLGDHAIQLLFDNKIVLCLDHYRNGEDKRMNETLLQLILNRLQNEYSFIINNKLLRIDRSYYTIHLEYVEPISFK